jgi:hypothetical protein
MSKELLYKAAYLIPADRSYGSWRYDTIGSARSVAELGRVKLVDKQDKYDDWAESTDLVLVFEVITPEGETAHFKMTGIVDSYGTERWTGKLVPVKTSTKTVTTYVEV